MLRDTNNKSSLHFRKSDPIRCVCTGHIQGDNAILEAKQTRANPCWPVPAKLYFDGIPTGQLCPTGLRFRHSGRLLQQLKRPCHCPSVLSNADLASMRSFCRCYSAAYRIPKKPHERKKACRTQIGLLNKPRSHPRLAQGKSPKSSKSPRKYLRSRSIR